MQKKIKKNSRLSMKKKKKEQHIGSSFDDFLEEEEILVEAETIAAKRVFVYQLQKELKKQEIDVEELAELMGTSRSAIYRLINPDCPSTLRTLGTAARAVGKNLKLTLIWGISASMHKKSNRLFLA